MWSIHLLILQVIFHSNKESIRHYFVYYYKQPCRNNNLTPQNYNCGTWQHFLPNLNLGWNCLPKILMLLQICWESIHPLNWIPSSFIAFYLCYSGQVCPFCLGFSPIFGWFRLTKCSKEVEHHIFLLDNQGDSIPFFRKNSLWIRSLQEACYVYENSSLWSKFPFYDAWNY